MKTKKQLMREIEELTEHNQKLMERNNALCEEVHKLREGDRICDEYCTGCVHLIETKKYISSASYGIEERTDRLCGLNRRCEDYKQGGENSEAYFNWYKFGYTKGYKDCKEGKPFNNEI